MSLPLFVLAVIALMTAHVVRTVRWRILLSACDVQVSNVRPLTALSVGYLVNTLLPLRLGELVRTWLLSSTTRSRFSTVLGTVVVERLVDLLVVGLLMSVTVGYHARLNAVAWTLLIPFAAVLGLFAIRSLLGLRRSLWLLASIFNEGIKSAILHLFFVVLELIFNRRIFRSARFWGLTLLMWGLYLGSLVLFARASQASLWALFSSVYVHALDLRSLLSLNLHDAWLLTYLTLPVPLILIYAYLSGFNALSGLRAALRAATRLEHYSGSVPGGRLHGFRSDDQYHSFLDRYFRGEGGLLSDFEQRGIGDVQVHRVFHGGSGAITALVEVDNRLRVRKFASGSLADKLAIQHDWLHAHREELPLVQVLSTRADNGDYFYDMAYVGGSRDLYEGIHTDPLEHSISTLDHVIDAMAAFHQLTRAEDAGADVVGAYVDAKVIANFAVIEREFEDIFQLQVINLNGESFELSKLQFLKNRAWFVSKFRHRQQASIHGDLTIENIMLDASAENSKWFLIDPNPVNGFQSPLIDFAKLMQSLHLGYEALHKMPRATLSDNKMSVGLHRSAQYERIHAHVTKEIERRFGSDVVKEVALHEIVNYLRLIPYQLRASREAGLAFFGCLCILVREFDRMYPGEIGA
ncbi:MULTISPECIES: lysylphosphatidylglycerol synthase domain-containing protein [Xanthomonas]|nr:MULTISPECIES: lysylphosphatidylglycerol synthase domain-containing protein [Xanthomonas]